MKKNKAVGMRKVFAECALAMKIPVMFSTLTEILTCVLGVFTANTLGTFTDAALKLDLSLGGSSIVALIACVLATVVLVPLFGMLGDFSMLKQALRHDNIVFGHYLDKKPEKSRTQDLGELQYELEDAPNTLRIHWVTLLGKGLSFPVGFVFLLYCAGNISWLLTGLLILLALVRLLVPIAYKSILAKYDKLLQEYNAKRRSYESDVTASLNNIKIMGIQAPMVKRIDQLFLDFFAKDQTQFIKLQVVSEQLQELVNNLTYLFLFLGGAIMVAINLVTPGNFAAVLIYLPVAQALFTNMGDIILKYPLLINAANRVLDIYEDAEDISGKDIAHVTILKGEKIGVAISDKQILKDVSFSIAAGEHVGIIGENGSGKSTFIKLITSLITQYQGILTIDKDNFAACNKIDWRKKIAFAPQTPWLFSATVKENLIMGNAGVDEDQVNTLMNDFGLLQLGDRIISADTDLSGGEKQKISLVRALLKKSDLLILDEPTNHLDQNSIAVLREYINRTTKTVILVSHDESLKAVVQKYIRINTL